MGSTQNPEVLVLVPTGTAIDETKPVAPHGVPGI